MREGLALEHGSEVVATTLEKKVTPILTPRRGMLHCADKTLLGIHSMKYAEFLPVLHPFLNFLHQHLSTENGGNLTVR
jgi:hypothetical protein